MNAVRGIEVRTVRRGSKRVKMPGVPSFEVEAPAPEEVQVLDEEQEARSKLYFVPAQGGNGGTPFEFLHWDPENKCYHKVKTFDVWIESGKAMRAVRVIFDDDWPKPAGKTEIRNYKLDLHWDKGELVTLTTLFTSPWKRQDSLRVNGIAIKTDKVWDQKFHHMAGNISTPVAQPTPYVDETQGTLVGIYGAEGEDIDRLGLILEPLRDVQYIFEDVNSVNHRLR